MLNFQHTDDPRYYSERLFVKVNHKNELYFSMILFKNKVNRVYVSEINIVVFKRRNYNFRLNKWNICSINCYETYENLKFTISKLRSETKNIWIWKSTFRSDGSRFRILVSFSNACKKKRKIEGRASALRGGEISVETHTQILLSYLIYVHIFKYTILHYL